MRNFTEMQTEYVSININLLLSTKTIDRKYTVTVSLNGQNIKKFLRNLQEEF